MYKEKSGNSDTAAVWPGKKRVFGYSSFCRLATLPNQFRAKIFASGQLEASNGSVDQESGSWGKKERMQNGILKIESIFVNFSLISNFFDFFGWHA
jgi:hypothetical protein